MQQSTNRILSERKRFYFNRGIEFIIKDPIPDNIDMDKIIGLLRANLPESSYEGLSNVSYFRISNFFVYQIIKFLFIIGIDEIKII